MRDTFEKEMIRSKAKLAPFMLNRESVERLDDRSMNAMNPPFCSLRPCSGLASIVRSAHDSGRTTIFAFVRTIEKNLS
jgi:hypothetical protein